MAAVFANGITTGIYATNSPEMCKYMANHRDVLTLRIEILYDFTQYAYVVHRNLQKSF